MFDKLFTKKKKEEDLFYLPDRKALPDSKALSKMGPKALQDLLLEQQKYTTSLQEKVKHIKESFQALQVKNEQLQEKNQVINGQIFKMTNEHQQLTIKFDNLQSSLDGMILHSESLLQEQWKFLSSQGQQPAEKNSLEDVLKLYQDRLVLCGKISKQNRTLKEKINEIQLQFDEIKQKSENAEKENGYEKLLPQMLETIEELRRERRQSLGTCLNGQNQNKLVENKQQSADREQHQKVRDQHQKLRDQVQKLISQNSQLNAQVIQLEKNTQNYNQLKLINGSLKGELQQFKSQVEALRSKLKQNSSSALANEAQQTDYTMEHFSHSEPAHTKSINDPLNNTAILVAVGQTQTQKPQPEENLVSTLLQSPSTQNDRQEEISQLKAQLEQQQSYLRQEQQKNAKLQEEVNILFRRVNNLQEQRSLMQEQHQSALTDLNNQQRKIQTDKESLIKQLKTVKQTVTSLQKNCQTFKHETYGYTNTIQKLNKEIGQNHLLIEELKAFLLSKDQQIRKLQIELAKAYEQLKTKQRKYDSELNQQRIKTETMRRTLNNQETKLEENEKSLNKFYEDTLHKDKKITFMEIKLKEYKHLIQSLKKEKDELEKSYSTRLKTYEDSIQEVPSEDDSVQEPEQLQKQNFNKKPVDLDPPQERNANSEQFYYVRNQLMSYEQSNLILKQENQQLRSQIQELELEVSERQKIIENLQEKRQQTLKEIQRLNLRSPRSNFGSQQTFQVEKQRRELSEKEKKLKEQKREWQEERQKVLVRVKKVASKAYKGFDILLKKHQELYKDFMIVFVKELVRQEVKGIESELNSLIKKSTDMKDVFQDYL